jgi:hypothetical protein
MDLGSPGVREMNPKALQRPEHFVHCWRRHPEVRLEVPLSRGPPMKPVVAMDEGQILALLGRVTEAARTRPYQVRPRVHCACEAVL